ncbi:Hsp70 family protein [Nonomuraea wenchangensis]
MADHRVVAAIDYGTHGSGYAWTIVDERNRRRKDREIFDRQQWPGLTGVYPKTLSALLVDRATGEVEEWGYRAYVRHRELSAVSGDPSAYDYVRGIKMSLRPKDDLSHALGGADAFDDGVRDPVPLIGKYLREMRQVAVAEITATGDYQESDIRWCLTVPAIWDQASMQRMREAAALAGLPSDPEKLLLVPEPDAAAIYCNVTGARPPGDGDAPSQRDLQRPGTRFMVIDCGGGTADLVCYEVTPDGTLDQLCKPDGGPFGAEYTTREFLLSVLSHRFGDSMDLEDLDRRFWAQFDAIVQAWERDRNTYHASAERPVYIDIPNRLYRELGRNVVDNIAKWQDGIDMIVLRPDEIRRVLDGVIDNILGKVDEQLANLPSEAPRHGGIDHAYLVGGFAQSPYLQQRLAEHLAGKAQVLVPPRPERAVLHGAVHYCYEPASIHARRAANTYGANVYRSFERQDPPDRLYVTADGRRYCADRFNRFVVINEKVPVDTEVSRTSLPLEESQSSISFTLYATKLTDPRYCAQEEVQRIGHLAVSLEGAMHLPRKDRSVTLYMKFGTAEIQVRAVVEHTGLTARTVVRFDAAY